MSEFLEVTNIKKRFANADRAALNNVSFSAQHKELIALVGSSGSGKTTMLRILAGLESPDQGAVSVGGEVLTQDSRILLPPERRNVGFVFQNHALFPHLSVHDNVGFGIASSDNCKMRVAELLDLVGMSAFSSRYPHELSGGEQQRVALIRALAPSPGLLLMDEPFSSLDEELRVELRDETRRLVSQQGITTILVTHHVEDAKAVADRIVVLKSGAVEKTGTPAEIYQ